MKQFKWYNCVPWSHSYEYSNSSFVSPSFYSCTNILNLWSHTCKKTYTWVLLLVCKLLTDFWYAGSKTYVYRVLYSCVLPKLNLIIRRNEDEQILIKLIISHYLWVLRFILESRRMRSTRCGRDFHPCRWPMKIRAFLLFITCSTAYAGIHIRLTVISSSWSAESSTTATAKPTSVPFISEMVLNDPSHSSLLLVL